MGIIRKGFLLAVGIITIALEEVNHAKAEAKNALSKQAQKTKVKIIRTKKF